MPGAKAILGPRPFYFISLLHANKYGGIRTMHWVLTYARRPELRLEHGVYRFLSEQFGLQKRWLNSLMSVTRQKWRGVR